MDNRVNEEMVEWLSKPENEELLETLKLIKESSKSADWFEDLNSKERKSIDQTLNSDGFWNKHSL